MTDSKLVVRVPSNMSEPAFTDAALTQMSDGFVNFVSRIGTSQDKSWWGTYAIPYMVQQEIDAAYRTTWLGKGVDIPPFDETREWREWTGADKDQIALIDAEEKRLGVVAKVRDAMILARKDGASALILGTDTRADNQPLDPLTIGQGGLKYITVCSKLDIQPGDREDNPLNVNFNEPRDWRLRNPESSLVHASRVIKFVGKPLRQAGYWDGWNGDPVWMATRTSTKNADQIAAAIASLVDEAKVDVFRLDGFMSKIATGEYEAAMTARWSAMATAKSAVNAILLDKLDEYEQKTLTFQGLTDIQMLALTIAAGAFDIPVTRFLGTPPTGMNATGESDMRNYYDRCRAHQTNDLQPKITPLDECLIVSALGSRPKEIYYTWNPLYSLNETEAAAVEKTMMEVWTGYANAGLVPDTALATGVKDGLIERGNMPGVEQAFDDADEEGDLPGLLQEPTEAEQAAEEAQTAIAKAQAANPAQAAFPKPRLVASRDARFTDATPRTLYVRRDVKNVAEIRKWATENGFTDIVPDLHVTIVHSRAPVDWMKMGASWEGEMKIAAGGPRMMENFGPQGDTRVLLFAATELGWRHRAAIEAGASSDYDEYQPHITIQKGGDIDLENVTPYQGKIVLGPEVFEEIRE